MNLINLFQEFIRPPAKKSNYICREISKELVSREFKFDKLQDITEAAQRYEHHVMPISVTKNISNPISKVQTGAFITKKTPKVSIRIINNVTVSNDQS